MIVLKYRKEPFLMAHQHAFLRDAGPFGLLLVEQRMSRRAILRRLVGLTLAGGSITSFITACGSPTNTSPAFHQIAAPSAFQSDTIPAPQPPTASSHSKALYTYHGHFASVNAVAWSPDGKRIAAGSNDGTVQVWDAANGEHVFTYRGHADHVVTEAWSPDGKRIASGSNDGTAQAWDAANGGHVFIYRGHTDHVNAVPWSPDGKRIASGSDDDTVQVWDAANGGHVFTYRGHTDAIWGVAWSPNGKRIASGSADKTVQVWLVR